MLLITGTNLAVTTLTEIDDNKYSCIFLHNSPVKKAEYEVF